MIKDKYKKIVSAMLMMTMIATTFSVDVFAGGDTSIVTINCADVFKGCCKGEQDNDSNDKSNKAVPVSQSEPASTHNDNQNYKFNQDTGQLTLLSNYKGTEPIATYMDKSQLESIKKVTIERGIVRLVGTFQECYHLTSVIILDTVKEIGENAFADCKELESINIPASVTKIGAYAFKGCTSLKKVTISSSSTEIDENAFADCPVELPKPDPQPEPPKSEVVIDPISPPTSFIPTEVTRVDNSIQTNEEVVIDSITVPTSIILTEADKVDNSVQASEKIVKVEDSIQTSEPEVVIDSIVPPDNIISIKTDRVDNSIPASEKSDKMYNSIRASEEVAKINSFTQTYKKDIILQQIPQSCKCGTNVGYTFNIKTGELTIYGIGKMDNYSGWPDFSITPPWESYKDCIKSVKIEDGVTKIGKGAFYNCTNLISINIPDSVTKICSFAFSGCTGLLSVDIPESVDSIGDSAFYNCKNLKNITILSSLDFIDHHAFYGCKNLNSVIYYGNRQPEIGVYRRLSLYPVFIKCSNLNEIHVPYDYKEDTFCGIQVIKGKI